MWLFTKHGFFSVVCTDDGEFQVRARRKEHLQNLLRLAGLKRTVIKRTVGKDYRWRFKINVALWSSLATVLAEDIDYSNFKSEAHRELQDAEFDEVLHIVWYVTHKYQE